MANGFVLVRNHGDGVHSHRSLYFQRVRHSRAGQWTAATFAVCGIVLNRIDVGGVAHPRPDGAFYLPSWTEIAISVGIVSAAALAFLFMIEHFKVWEESPADPDADPLKLPELDPVDATWLGVPGIAARTPIRWHSSWRPPWVSAS